MNNSKQNWFFNPQNYHPPTHIDVNASAKLPVENIECCNLSCNLTIYKTDK